MDGGNGCSGLEQPMKDASGQKCADNLSKDEPGRIHWPDAGEGIGHASRNGYRRVCKASGRCEPVACDEYSATATGMISGRKRRHPRIVASNPNVAIASDRNCASHRRADDRRHGVVDGPDADRDSGGLRAGERFQSRAAAPGGSSIGGIALSQGPDVCRVKFLDPIGICFDS